MKQGSDLLDLFEHPLGVPESFLNPNAVPAVPLPPPALPDESIEAESAQNGPGGLGSVVAETSGGLVINLLFDAAAMAAPLSFRQGIEQAAAILSGAISDKITVNLDIDYSGAGGGAAAGPDDGQFVSYSTVRADLVNNATTGDTTFNALPSGSTIQGQSSVAVWNAQLKVLGLLGANDTTTDDGSATFATDINPNLLVGVALHELTHAMGRVPYGPQSDIFDFFRFTSPGTRLFLNGATAPAAYFSLDGGTTKLANYGQTSDASDFLNSGVQGSNDPFNEFYSGSTLQQLTAIDLKELDALGFHLTSNQPMVIEALGSTSLLEQAGNFYLDNISSGTGPELKYGGANVVAGQFGSGWTPVGTEQTSTGYEVAWQIRGTNQFTIWTTDSSGNYLTSNGTVSGTSLAVEQAESVLHQDLNGDGVIGVPSTVIESFGSTSLVENASNFFLDNISSGTGPDLKYGGAAVVAGQFGGGWTPVGAEQTSTGYEVAWKIAGTSSFTIWTTDSSGNYLTSDGTVSGTSHDVEQAEIVLHQDLNGDGVIGLPSTVIESFGSTSLVENASNFFLDNISSGIGPELKYGGAAVVAGQFGAGWIPVGVEQTSTGYEVAWQISGTEQFTIWTTDSNGNYLTSGGTVSGTSLAVEQAESVLHQDLNGDGVIGLPNTSSGSTSLVTVGSNFYLDNAGTGTGPELKYGGVAVVAGQFGSGWTPIGAAQTSTGYEVAWKIPGSDQYTIWTTDGNANYLSNDGTVSGNSHDVEQAENVLHQDLNGDGVIGVPSGSTVVSLAIAGAAGSSANDTFVFLPAASAAAPANGNQPAVVWSDPGFGHEQALFQTADSGHIETVEAGNHDGLWTLHGLAGLTHGFIIH